MKKNNILLLLLLFLTRLTFGQSAEKWLDGKITADSLSVEKVNIINSRNENATITEKGGSFKIKIRNGDILVISAVHLETRRKAITQEDFTAGFIEIKMNARMNPLEEVDVNEYSKINSVNLGITSGDQKRYTPAERKLYTARSGLFDPLLNKMSGRTTMLKKEVVVEQNERTLRRLDGLYEENYYTDVLKIPKDYIKGFQYFLIEDRDYVRALNDKNKTMTMFLIKRLALRYNEIIRNEGQPVTD